MINHRYIIFYLFCLHIDIYVNIYTRCFGVNASSNYLRNNVSTFDYGNVEDNNFVIGDNYYLNYENNNQDIISNPHKDKLPNTSQEHIEVANENSHDPKIQDEEISVIKTLGDHNHVKSKDIGVIGNDTTDGLSVTNSGFNDGSAFGGGLTFSENSPLQGGLNKCPVDKFCESLVSVPHCPKKNFEERNNWISTIAKHSSGQYKRVPSPARRRKLCFGNIKKRRNGITDREKFKKELINIASTEGKLLVEMYSKEPEYALEAMRYSFADIGNIIKGNDIMDDFLMNNVKDIFEKKINKDRTGLDIIGRNSWWENNKNDIWDAMMCKYNRKKDEKICPGYNNIDNVPQFFRWFREWGTYICKELKKYRELLKSVCHNFENKPHNKVVNGGITRDDICKGIFKEYENLVNSRKNEWNLFVEYYNIEKDAYSGSKGLLPETYLKEYCNECYFQNKDLKCILEEIEKNNNIYKDIYEGKYFQGSVTTTSHEISNSNDNSQTDGAANDGLQSGTGQRELSVSQNEIPRRSDSTHSGTISPNSGNQADRTGQVLNNLSGEKEERSLESGKINTDNERHGASKDDIPYDRILGWEFGDFSPKNKYTEDEKKKNILELINLTSWDRDNIANENEEVEEEEMYTIDVGEIELEEEEEVEKEEEQQVEDEIELEEEEQVEEEEDEEEEEEEEEEEVEGVKQKEGDTEATKKNLEENDQTPNDKENEKEETADLTRDNDAYQSLKERSNDNKQVKKVDESAIKNLFDLFNKSNDSEDVLKGLVREITSLFQNH
ncbi:duffy binding-like merozoite surface protein [Plasmodium gaboni]|uniref:Duffy binding-like merozoite surface protein n=1 Tax=Plasmodium gaboni TaxID=647221 RepID=A0A151L2L0_9APIC|nr:duffy binding-like merozoite surface protein [Plasmodium gaboni]KYN93097.1 duffy binding-like merozoite surface protein [Plasmodium gaboni]